MMTYAKRCGLAALTVAAMSWSGSSGQAAFRYVPGYIGYAGAPVNQNWLIAPGLNLRQGVYNMAQLGRAYRYIPPYLLGYNPYPQVANYGMMYTPISPYGGTPYTNPYGGGYSSPYASLYSGGYGSPGAYGGGAAALSSATGLPSSAGYDMGYGGSNPYTTPYDPTGGFLAGAADVVNSQGKLVIQLEQSKVVREKARQAHIDTRRRLFDEIMYERAHTPSFTEQREKMAREALRYSLNVAPVTEIWSAKALNDILADLKKLNFNSKLKPLDIPLPADMLKQVNVAGGGNGNIGLLRHKGRLSWPLGLVDLKPAGEAEELRNTLNAKALEAVSQASTGTVKSGVIRDLQINVAKLHRLLAKNVNELPANEYIQAKRFLNQFDDAIRALQDPNVGNYFNNKYVAEGKNVQELVQNMLKRGLTFAPAVSGDEAAYQALHGALAAYDNELHQQLGVAKEDKDKEDKE